MSESIRLKFTFSDVVKALLKEEGITEGNWALSLQYGIQAMNIGADDDHMNPAALIPLIDIGIERSEKISNLSFDASTFAQSKPASSKKKTAKKKVAKKKASPKR